MLHRIENKKLICEITSNGAEIRSLRDKLTGKEYIWQIDEEVWGSSSPVLFPAIGKIKSGEIHYQGRSYAMPKHGIIRNNADLIFTKIKNNKCAFKLESSDKTLLQFPFQFTFEVIYELIDNRLVMTYNIQNNDKVELPFICGGHTAYACPLDNKTQLSDYLIDIPDQNNLKAGTLGESGLLSDKIRAISLNQSCLSLSESIFDEDALILEGINFDWVRLRKKDEKKGVKIIFKGYPNLAFWSKPGADYVCIEPWLGLPDRENESTDITKKSTYKKINPKDSYATSIITVLE